MPSLNQTELGKGTWMQKTCQIQLINREEKMESENHPLATTTIIVSGKNHYWMLKLVGVVLLENKVIYVVSKYFPRRY